MEKIKETKEHKVIHIKDWPEGDRPREMLLEKGPEALSDAGGGRKENPVKAFSRFNLR